MWIGMKKLIGLKRLALAAITSIGVIGNFLTDRDLSLLDKHEGFPRDYGRINVKVNNEDGDPVEAVTYIRAAQSEETSPSQDYLSVVQQGYRDWGLI